MNLTINPISLNGCNCPKPQVNFSQLPVKVIKPEYEKGMNSIIRERDKAADTFSALFERAAKKIGLDTDKLAEKGFILNFLPAGRLNSDMCVTVLNKSKGTIVSSPAGFAHVAYTSGLNKIDSIRDLAQFNLETVVPFTESIKKDFSFIA